MLAFGAAPVKTAVLAGSNPAGTCDLSLTEMIAEVRKRIPADANAELSNRQLSQEQVARLNLRPGDVGLLD